MAARKSWCAALAAAAALATAAPALAEEYGYDAAGRLVTVTYDDGSTAAFTYDANGSLLGVTRTGVPDPPTTSSSGSGGGGAGDPTGAGSTIASATQSGSGIAATGTGGGDGLEAGDDDGCGCRVVGAPLPSRSAGPLLLGLLAFAARRRLRGRSRRARGPAVVALAAAAAVAAPSEARAQGYDFIVDFGTTLGLGTGTAVTTQFQPMGVLFAGADGGPAYIVDDSAVPNTPVLAGTQFEYLGPIVVRYVDPNTGQPTPVATAGALATGFFDNLLSTEMRAYALDGTLLGSKRNRGTGVEALVMERSQADIARVEFLAVDQRAAGFAIDHVIARAAARPTTSANHTGSLTVRDPINTFTGELVLEEAADLDLGGTLPLRFARYYASGLDPAGMSGAAGASWRHAYEWTLDVQAGIAATIVTDRGRRVEFARGTGWSLVGRTDIVFQMWETVDRYHVRDPRTELVYGFSIADGKLDRIERHGRALTLTWSGDQLATVTDGAGHTLTFAHGADGLIDSVTDGTRTIELEHDAGGDLIAVTDAEGETTTYDYASGHLLEAATLAEGNQPLRQTWNGDGRVATQIDAEGAAWSLDYEEGETTITDPDGGVAVHRYGGDGELVELEGQDGLVALAGYDLDGQRNLVTDRTGETIATTWHFPSGEIESTTDAAGQITTYYYSARSLGGVTVHDLTSIAYPDGSGEYRGYDSFGRLNYLGLPGDRTWSLLWGDDGLLSSVVDPLGGLVEFTYGADDRPATTTDQSGNETAYDWDGLGRLIEIEHADGTTRRFQHDARGALIELEDERGETTTWAHDANGDVVERTDPLGHTTSWEYDDLRRVVATTDPLGRTTWTGSFDARGNLVATADGSGAESTAEYDERGRKIATVDGLGEVWPRTWDEESLLASVADPLGNVTTLGRDEVGRMTAVTSPGGHTTALELDEVGRIVGVTDPSGVASTIAYDDRGFVSAVFEGEGISGAWLRDRMGNATTIYDPLSNAWSRSYDVGGRLASETDPLGRSTTFEYDERNRVTRIDHPAGGFDLEYDAVGRLIGQSHDDGLEIELEVDARGSITGGTRLDLSWDEMGRIASSNGVEIERDVAGRVEVVRYAPGREVTYVYDGRGQLASVEDWLGGTTTFAYDTAGRLEELGRPNGAVTTYQWDEDSWLVRIEDEGLASIALTRDDAGRITGATRDVPLAADAALVAPVALTYDAAAQVSSFTYDGLGRLLDDGTSAYGWDGASRLTSITRGGDTVDVSYDALGLRTSRTVDGADRQLVWSYGMDLPVVAIERAGGEDLRSYVHTPGGALLYSIDADGARRFHHYDENGNTLFVTDDEAAIEAAYAYGPYGLSRATAEVDNAFTWQGQHGAIDEGGGLYNLRVRWYDATAARFLSRDPVPAGDVRSLNPYQYVSQDPLGSVDPMGTDRRVVFGGHAWLIVDTYDQQGRKSGQLSLHFSPSGWTTNLPRQDAYPTDLQYTIPSSREADEKLVALWRYMNRKPDAAFWSPGYNCISATMQFRDYGIGSTPDVPYHPSQGPLAGPDDSAAGRAEMDRRYGLAWQGASGFSESFDVWKDYQKYKIARLFGMD